MSAETGRTIETTGAAHTEALGRAVGEVAEAGLYLALDGELGGGKTTFVRGLAAGLGAAARVASPTFVIMREYCGRLPLYHCDFYRLEHGGDIAELELDACLERGVVAAEWASLFEPPRGARVLAVHFEWTGDEARRVTMTAHCERTRKLLAGIKL